MLDILNIQKAVLQLQDLHGEEKLVAARKAYHDVSEAERYAAFHYEVPADVVQQIRELIPVVSAHVNRLEAGARKRSARAELRRQEA